MCVCVCMCVYVYMDMCVVSVCCLYRVDLRELGWGLALALGLGTGGKRTRPDGARSPAATAAAVWFFPPPDIVFAVQLLLLLPLHTLVSRAALLQPPEPLGTWRSCDSLSALPPVLGKMASRCNRPAMQNIRGVRTVFCTWSVYIYSMMCVWDD